MNRGKPVTSTAIGSLLALALGVALGLLVFRSQSAWWLKAADTVSAVGTLWTNALRLTVIPLIASTLVVAVAGQSGRKGVGRITGLSFAAFASLLATGVLLVLLTLPAILSRTGLRGSASLQIRSNDAVEDATLAGKTGKSSSINDIIATILPSNLLRAAAEDDLLPLVAFSILIGLAASRIAGERQVVFVSLMRGLSESMRIIIGWILWVMPLGIFAFSFASSANLGWSTVRILGSWVAVVSVLSLSLTAGLYLIALLVGGARLSAFAKAVLPAQGVALATRSSLAALPALLKGAQKHLPGNSTATNVALPLAVSSFKLNRSINSTSRLLFLAYVYGVGLTPAGIASFVVAAMLMSFTSPGLPTRGPGATLPLYVAAGIPLEGIILLKSVDSITDFAMTVLNVTGDMTAMTIVARLSGPEGHGDEIETTSEVMVGDRTL